MQRTVHDVVMSPIERLFRRAGGELVYNALVNPYFQRAKTRLAVAGITASNALIVGLGVQYSNFIHFATDHLTSKDLPALTNDLSVYGALSAATVSAMLLRTYLSQRLALSARNWAGEQLVKRWCSPENMHNLVTKKSGTDKHPDQRLTQDLWAVVEFSLQQATGVTSNLANVASFYAVLYQISPLVTAVGATVSLSGFTAARYVSRQMDACLKEMNDENAKHRSQIKGIDDNRLKISLYGGEKAAEKLLADTCQRMSGLVQRNNRHLNILTAVNMTVSKFAFVVPYACLMPDYLKLGSSTTYGQMNQANQAYRSAQDGTDWFAYNTWMMTQLGVSVRNLNTFLADNEVSAEKANRALSYKPTGPTAVSVREVDIGVPGSKPLCRGVTFDLKAGDRMVILGNNGCGKTTLLAALMGVVPLLKGTIAYSGLKRNPGEIMSLTRDPYLPEGSLSEVLTFPRAEGKFSDEQIAEALKTVGLDKCLPFLAGRDSSTAAERQMLKGLSTGEQQRLDYARLLLHKPKLIGLDEATNGLKPDQEVELNKILFAAVPDSIIISINHQNDDLKAMHTHIATIADHQLDFRTTDVQNATLNAARTSDAPERNGLMLTLKAGKSMHTFAGAK